MENSPGDPESADVSDADGMQMDRWAALEPLRSLCLLVAPDGCVHYANAAATEALGEGLGEIGDILRRADDGTFTAEAPPDGAAKHRDVLVPTRTGKRWYSVSVSQEVDGLSLIEAHDVDERRRSEDEARETLNHDPLTGLPNRSLFMRELEQRLHERGPAPFGVLVLDLDRFRQINDSLGRDIGDRILQEFARRLNLLAGRDSLVGRSDGDEFIIATAAGVEPETLGNAILDAMANPMVIGNACLHVMPSIGGCQFPEQGRSVAHLVTNADLAMTRAKRQQLGFARFDKEMCQSVRAELELENDLVIGVRRHQFEAFFQPRVSALSGEVTGFEALARWRHPDRGLLTPDKFIDAAEATGLIVPLGNQIMFEAMKQQAAWRHSGYDLTVSINVSALQVSAGDLPASVAANLTRSGCDPRRIELEITESAFVGDVHGAVEALERVVALGPRIALDDFGTGYSNLAHLVRYPLHTLKIDRAFVSNPDQRRVLDAIVGIGTALELEMVAEGIESPDIVPWLIERGVAEMQGYFYGRPMEAAAATRHLIECRAPTRAA